MVPGIFPRNILSTLTFARSPVFLSTARGVAVVTPSYENDVILPANDMRRKHLAPSAGFMKLNPSPPKSCLTIIMANALPSIAIHTGTSGERFSARRSPVTTALRSLMVTFLFIIFWYSHSNSTHETTHVSISIIAFSSKLMIPNTVAGSKAMITSSIMLCVLRLSLTCGDDEILNVLSNVYTSYFFLFAMMDFLVPAMVCVRCLFAGHTYEQHPHSQHSIPL